MRLERGKSAEGPLISGFSGGGFRVDDNVYLGLVITPERAGSWAPPPLAELTADDLAPVLALDPLPEFVLLGTGAALVRPHPRVEQLLNARGVGLEVLDSRAAARTWGVLRAEQRWVAGALYPFV